MATSAKALFRATKRKPKPHADQATLIDAPEARRPNDETRRPLDLYPTGQPEAIRALPRGQALLLATGQKAALLTLQPWYAGPHAKAITAATKHAEAAITARARAGGPR